MRKDSVRLIIRRDLASRPSVSNPSAWTVFEPFLRFFPILSVCMFVLGSLKITAFYGSFNINILNYITASELLFSLLPLCTFIVVIVFLPLFWGMVRYNLPPIKWFPKVRISSVANSFLMMLNTVIFGCLAFLTPVHADLYQFKPYFIIAMWFIPGIDIFLTYFRSKKNKLSPVDILIPLVLCGFAMYSYGSLNAGVVKTKGSDNCYSFKWKDRLFKSDSTEFIVGEVQNYLISYRPKDSTTTVYKRSEIDSLVIKPFH